MTLTAAAWLIILTALVLANLPFAVNRPLAPWPWRMAAGPFGAWWRWGRTVLFLLALALWSWGTLEIVGGAFSGGGDSAALFTLKLLISAGLAGLLLAWPGWEKHRLETATGLAGGAIPGVDASRSPGQRAAGSTTASLGAAGSADASSSAGSAIRGSGDSLPVGAQAPGKDGASAVDVRAGATEADKALQQAQARARAIRRNPALSKPFIDRLLELLVGYVLVGTLGYALELNRGNAFHQQWEFYAVTLALFLVLGYPGFVLRYMLKHNYRGI